MSTDINDEVQKIIRGSRFVIEPEIFVYTKVATYPKEGGHFFVSQDTDEITVVTTIDKLEELDLIERNKEDYKLLALEVSVPFYSVGFLAVVSNAIAREQMNILLVSTYSKDYLLVKQDDLPKTEQILLSLGFQN